MVRSIAHCAAATLLLSLIACSDRNDVEETATTETERVPPEAPVSAPHVLESFQVGEQAYVRSLAVEEARNVLWVGTSVGVLEIDLGTQQVRNTFTRKDDLANEYVFAIGIDSEGHKWFGTNAGGVSRYRDGDWQVYFPMHGLADYWIYSFAEQPGRQWWIGTWAGVNRVDLDTMKFETFVDELVNEWVYAIDVDSGGRVWFGTEGGITMFDGSSWQHWTHADGLGAANVAGSPASPNTGLGTRSRHSLSVLVEGEESYNPNYVFALSVDSEDNVWAGTWGGGVARFDGNEWTNYTVRDGLAGNIVYSMVREPSGVFWFGTNRGLSRYDGNTWITFDRESGLLADHVYAIAIAPNEEIWVGTKRGVTRLGY